MTIEAVDAKTLETGHQKEKDGVMKLHIGRTIITGYENCPLGAPISDQSPLRIPIGTVLHIAKRYSDEANNSFVEKPEGRTIHYRRLEELLGAAQGIDVPHRTRITIFRNNDKPVVSLNNRHLRGLAYMLQRFSSLHGDALAFVSQHFGDAKNITIQGKPNEENSLVLIDARIISHVDKKSRTET